MAVVMVDKEVVGWIEEKNIYRENILAYWVLHGNLFVQLPNKRPVFKEAESLFLCSQKHTIRICLQIVNCCPELLTIVF